MPIFFLQEKKDFIFKLCPFGTFAIRSMVLLIKGNMITCY